MRITSVFWFVNPERDLRYMTLLFLTTFQQETCTTHTYTHTDSRGFVPMPV